MRSTAIGCVQRSNDTNVCTMPQNLFIFNYDRKVGKYENYCSKEFVHNKTAVQVTCSQKIKKMHSIFSLLPLVNESSEDVIPSGNASGTKYYAYTHLTPSTSHGMQNICTSLLLHPPKHTIVHMICTKFYAYTTLKNLSTLSI